MVWCSVFGCNNGYKKKGNRIEHKFFCFPKEPQIRKIWIAKCRRTGPFKPENARICDIHFDTSDFERNLQAELLNLEKFKVFLKKGAIPSKNLPGEKVISTSQKNRRERIKMKLEDENRKQILNDLLNRELITEDDISKDPSTSANVIQESNEFQETTVCNGCINKNNEIEQFKILLGKYEENSKNLLQQVKKMGKEIAMLKKENNGIEKIFTKNQRIAIQNPLKKKFWHESDIASAISLRSAGPQAYRWLLKNNFPYPAESTLRCWESKIKKHKKIEINE